jgi:hypothetical protein
VDREAKAAAGGEDEAQRIWDAIGARELPTSKAAVRTVTRLGASLREALGKYSGSERKRRMEVAGLKPGEA